MRLTRKFIAALVIGVALVALVQGYLDYQRDRDVLDRQLRAEAASLGRALGYGVADVWQREGDQAARQFLDTAATKSVPSAERFKPVMGLSVSCFHTIAPASLKA